MGSAHAIVAGGEAQGQHAAFQAVAASAHASVVSPLAEYDVEGSGDSGSEDSDAPFARADAAAAAAAAAASEGSPSADAVPSADGAVADEEEGEDSDENEEEEEEGSYSDVDGDSDPEDCAIRCSLLPALLRCPLTMSSRDEISKCANMLARTTLQVETLRAIIEDCSDDDEGPADNHVDLQHHHNVQIGFSIASAPPHAPPALQSPALPPSVLDGALSAERCERDIVTALDCCVHEMAALDPQEKLVHCATVLQVVFPTCFHPIL